MPMRAVNFKTGRLVSPRVAVVLVVSLLSLAMVACSSTDSAEEGTSGPGPVESALASQNSGNAALALPEKTWTVISDEINLELATPDLGIGTQRFAVVLSDDKGLVKFPIVRLNAKFYPDGYELAEDESFASTSTARFHEFPFGTRGLHSTEFNFDRAGLWSVSADIPRTDGSVAPVEVRFPVAETAMSITVGQQAPASDSRTLANVEHIRELTTGSYRDPELYRYSISDALGRDRPLLIVFASPAFCTNAVCGPQVEVASELREVYGDRVDFVHVDLYDNPQEIQGDLNKARLSPILNEWGLVSQEWTFIVGSDGTVVNRFENFAPKPELIEALDLAS